VRQISERVGDPFERILETVRLDMTDGSTDGWSESTIGGTKMKRFIGVTLAFVAVTIFALPASSFGAATRTPVLITTTVAPFQVAADETCGGVDGILTGTDTIAGQVVETDKGSHFAGSDTFVYRIDYVDGSYQLGAQTERLTFNGNPLHGVVILKGALLEKGTIYDANGNVIGYERFNNIYHLTVVDGTAVVEFSRGFLSCR